jgi:hypothetical protein
MKRHTEEYNESRRVEYKLNRQAEGKSYTPRTRVEQTSQPVEQDSQLVEKASIQTPRHKSG